MGWSRVIIKVVDSTKVNSADQVNMTIPIVVTNAELKSIANGGLCRADGFDIALFADTACLVMFKFQKIFYDPVAGTFKAWVKVPRLFSGSNIAIVCIGFGNSAITTDQQDKLNAWDANTATSHPAFGDGTTIDLTDHTGNFNLTNVGAVRAAGLIGDALSTNGASTYAEKTGGAPVTNYPFTIEGLIKPAAAVASTQTVFGLNASAGAPLGQGVFQVRATNAVRAQSGNSGSTPQTANNVLDTTNWHYIGGVWNADADRRLVVDGAAAIASAVSAGTTAAQDNFSVGAVANNNAHAQFYNGLTNFVILSSVGRADSWLITRNAATKDFATFTSEIGPFNVASTLAADIINLVTALGGDGICPVFYDAGINVNPVAGKVASIDDAIGTYNGRTPGPQLIEATAGNRPTLVGTQGSGSEYIEFSSASSQRLAAIAADARLQLSPNTPFNVIALYEATGTGPIGGVAANPASAVTYPYMLLQAAGTNHKGDFAPEGVTTGRIQPDSGIAFADGKTRVAGMVKSINVVGNAASDVTWEYWLGEYAIQIFRGATVATAGNLIPVLGRIGATHGNFRLKSFFILTKNITKADKQAILAFAANRASVQYTARRAVVCAGDSLEPGSQSTDPLTIAVGSGTTTPAAVMAANTSVPGLTFLDLHGFNYGVSGRHLQNIADEWAREISPLVNGYVTGPLLVFLRGIGNFVQNSNATIAQLRTVAASILTLANADDVKLVWHTEIDRGSGANGDNANDTAWYTSNTWATKSTNGNTVTTFNDDLRNSLATYGHYLIDLEALTQFQIMRAGTRAMLDATYFQAGKVHLQDAGYAIIGNERADFLNAFAPWMSSSGSGVMRRRRRRML